jgi:membrane-bound ClpP family serine protease
MTNSNSENTIKDNATVVFWLGLALSIIGVILIILSFTLEGRSLFYFIVFGIGALLIGLILITVSQYTKIQLNDSHFT